MTGKSAWDLGGKWFADKFKILPFKSLISQ
jgi:hypothetical protein